MASGGYALADFRCTKERTNFVRLCRATIDLCSQVLRDILSREIPSNKINNVAQRHPDLRLNLSQKRVLNLAISQGYQDFDISLLYLLIRKLCPTIFPTKGWNPTYPPPPSETTKGDDVERIHFIRNSVYGHVSSTLVSEAQFMHYWQILQDVMGRMESRLGGNYKAILTMMETDSMDEPNQKVFIEQIKEMKNAEKDLTTKFEEMQRNFIQTPYHRRTIERWVKENEFFVNTRAAESVKLAIRNKQLVSVFGPLGSGKSAIIHHTALELQEDGYCIVPVYSAEEITRYWSPEVKQVFVFDDPFGVHSVDEAECFNWTRRIQSFTDCLRDDKILVSMRTYFLHEQRIPEICRYLDIEIIDICSAELYLLEGEKYEIFLAHMKYNKRKIPSTWNAPLCNLSSFPLLCHIFAGDDNRGPDEIETFFKRPLSVLRDDLMAMKNYDKIKYFCLLLCLLYDNELEENMFDACLEQNEEEKWQVFLELCRLPKLTSKLLVRDRLESLIGTYFVKEGRKYKLLYGIITDAVIKTFSTEFKRPILRFFPSTFIRDRVIISEVPKNIISVTENKPFIHLDEELFDTWKERLIEDLNDGKAFDVFLTKCYDLDECDEILMQTLAQSKLSVSKQIQCICCYTKTFQSLAKRTIKQIEKIEYRNVYGLAYALNCEDVVPFHVIVARGLHKTFQYLWNNIDLCTKRYMASIPSLFHCAVLGENVMIIQQLIDAGADIDRFDKMNIIPLYLAIARGNEVITRLLLDKGADETKLPCHVFKKIFGCSFVTSVDLASNVANGKFAIVFSNPENIINDRDAKTTLMLLEFLTHGRLQPIHYKSLTFC